MLDDKLAYNKVKRAGNRMEGRMPLKLDHMIHYVQRLKDFNFPGDVLKIHSGVNMND